MFNMQINNINPIEHIKINDYQSNSKATQQINFSEFLKKAISNVDNMQKEVDKSGELLAAGQIDNLHTLPIETQKAEIALQLTIQIRNKIVDAYNEIMRMQL